MTEQQYRVIADRASMADESWIAEGDRVTYGTVNSTGELVIVRIERPVPPTDERTYWNGEPTPASRVRVVVGTSPRDTWWCANLVGTERAAVRVDYPAGEPFYIDDEDGSGWQKVTEGHGSPRWTHASLPVEREVQPTSSVPTREQIADEVSGIQVGNGYYATTIGIDAGLEVADAVLDLLRKGGE